MTTDNVVTPEETQDSPQKDSTQAPVNWEERANELEQQLKKLQNDGRSQAGRQRRQQELENMLLQSNNDTRIMNRKVDALIKAIGDGNTDSLPSELSQIQTQAAQSQADLDYQNVWLELSEELVESVQDDDGNQILDLQAAPELEAVRQIWTESHQKKDRTGLQRAVREAQKIVRRTEREQSRTQTREAHQAGRADAEGAGSFDLDTGPSSGGGNMSDDRWLSEVYGNPGYNPTPEDNKRAKTILDRMR